MEASHRPPVTDSPWFWVLMFSVMALGALAAISGKYGRRQAGIERQYQARQRLAEQQARGNNPVDAQRTEGQPTPQRRAFASPDDTLIPLWPLAAVLGLVALFSGAMLIRGRSSPSSPAAGPVAEERPV